MSMQIYHNSCYYRDTSKRPFGASNREKLARNEKKKSTPALELPILAKNGEKVFLKFSQLFADPIETDKPELRRVKRRIQEGNSNFACINERWLDLNKIRGHNLRDWERRCNSQIANLFQRKWLHFKEEKVLVRKCWRILSLHRFWKIITHI